MCDKRKWENWEKQFVTNNYGILSYKEMAESLKRTPASVKRWRLENIPSIVSQGKSKFSRKPVVYTCNENFFSEKSKESIYWAGFIAADGCIKDSTDNHQSQLHISLQKRDIKHLEKFKKDLNFSGTIHTGSSKYKYKGVESKKEWCKISVTSSKLCNDLLRIYNITPRKSLTLLPPTGLTKEESLWFIKGIIDGDGSISSLNENGVWSSKVSLCGTENVLLWVKKVLEDCTETTFRKNAITKVDGKNLYNFVISHKQGRKVIEILSRIPLGLDRKWDGKAELCKWYKDPRVKFSISDIKLILEALAMGVKQKDIALLCGVHQVTISQIKTGKCKWIGDGVMEGMCEVVDTEDAN